MVLVDPNSPVPNETPTLETQVLILKRKMRSINEPLSSLLTQALSVVWENPLDATPQEVVDQFGTDAVSLFTVAGLAAQIIAVATATSPIPLVPSGYSVVQNQDGTVTITQL